MKGRDSLQGVKEKKQDFWHSMGGDTMFCTLSGSAICLSPGSFGSVARLEKENRSENVKGLLTEQGSLR